MATIEKRGANSWRVGIRLSEAEGRGWVRRNAKFPVTMPEKEQRRQMDLIAAQLLLDIEAGKTPEQQQLKAFQTLADAGEASAGPPAGQDLPGSNAPQRYTVREMSVLWMNNHVIPNLSDNTRKNYQHFLDCRILPALGDYHLDELTPLLLSAFMSDLKEQKHISHAKDESELKRKRTPSDREKLSKKADKKLSLRSVNHYYDCLDFMLDKAVQWDLMDKNPMQKVDKQRPRKAPIQYLEDEQAVELLRKLQHEENMSFRAAVMLALLCGLRLGEVGGLMFQDVDFEEGTIDIQRARKYTPEQGNFDSDPKTEAGQRLIDLPPAMLTLLDETRKQHEEYAEQFPYVWHGDGHIVCNWDGKPYHHDTPSKQWRAFADKNGFEGFKFKGLRSAHGSLLFANNIDAVAVASRMGHSDASTTFRYYAQALRRRNKESAAVMQRLIERAENESKDQELDT